MRAARRLASRTLARSRSPAAIVFRMVMMIGAYLYVVSDSNRLEQLSDGHCDAEDQAEVIRQVCAFLTGGFKYPLKSAPGAAREFRSRPIA